MSSKQFLINLAHRCNVDGINVFVSGKSAYCHERKFILLEPFRSFRTRLIVLAHEYGHALDFRREFNWNMLRTAKKYKDYVPLFHNSVEFDGEQRAWRYAETILTAMGFFSELENYQKFSNIRRVNLDTYEAAYLNLSDEKLLHRSRVSRHHSRT